MNRIILSIFILLFGAQSIYAQQEFSLERARGGHYCFTAEVWGESAEIMLESGIPAFLIGRPFYEQSLTRLGTDLTFTESGGKIRLLNNVYDIALKAKGRIAVGGVWFDGPIFILDGYEGLSLPIQYLKGADGEPVVTVSLAQKWMKVGAWKPQTPVRSFRLKFKSGFPTVRAGVKLGTPEGTANLKGDLIVDFGNPSLLFLMKQDKSLERAVQKGSVLLRDARNANGDVIAQGIYALSVKMFGREFSEISIGVTDKMASIKQMGFLGTTFFETPVSFDFGKGLMLVEQ